MNCSANEAVVRRFYEELWNEQRARQDSNL
jgi:hypothetical protein